MNNKLTILLFLLISLYSQILFSQWTWVTPTPQGNNLVNFELLSNGKIVSTGNYGTVITSTDDGISWGVTNNLMNIKSNLISLFKLSDNILYTGSENGCILKSVNGGQNWSIIYDAFGSHAGVNKILFLNEQTGYAIVSHSIYMSSDGGINWVLQHNAGNDNLDDIYFIDQNTGIAVGGQFSKGQALLRTTNAGAQWTHIQTGGAYELYKIYFINSITGYVASIGQIIKTTNSGLNWTIINIQGDMFRDIHFFDVNTGYVLGDGVYNSLYRTTNGGVNWLAVPFNYYSSIVFGPVSFNFLNQQTGYVLTDQHTIIKTTNAGNNWNALTQSFCDYGTISSIQFINDNTGFIKHYQDLHSGVIKKTTDGGINWRNVANNIYDVQYFNAFQFISPTSGYAAGGGNSKGYIYKTTDVGESWVKIDSINTPNISALYFLDELTGFVYGGSSDIYKTTTGGHNWSVFSSGITNYVNSITFVNSLTGYLCGGNAQQKLLMTTNAGVNWSLRYSTTGSEFGNVKFINTATGFISGKGILKTTDAGITWNQKFNVQEYCRKVYFLNPETGFGLVNFGRVIKTTDEGETWGELNTPTNNYFNDITFLNDNMGFIVGEQGTILKTTNAGGNFIVGISHNETQANKYVLNQNYPNPFNPTTNIKFDLPKSGFVRLTIYDALGREVTTLIDEEMKAGSYNSEWNASSYSSGIYFYKLETADFAETKKMVLIK